MAVLFARSDSIYKTLPGVDVWDAERDARKWPGGCPVVAHPPCRAWGRLRSMAKPRHDERDLALWAVSQVRTWGGVLEHPAASTLWKAAGLPRPGEGCDAFGGYTVELQQGWFGHRAPKLSWFYVCRVERVPLVQPDLFEASHRVESMGKSEREKTPRAMAEWLLSAARRVQ